MALVFQLAGNILLQRLMLEANIAAILVQVTSFYIGMGPVWMAVALLL